MKHTKALLMLAMGGLFGACEKEEEKATPVLPVEVVAPLKLEFQGIHESNLLVDTESISLMANGGEGISKVDFYLGTTLVGSDETSPFELQLPSADYPDGSYELIAQVKDSSGKMHETRQAVKISNVLMQMPVLRFSQNSTNHSYHVIIATEAGEILQQHTITAAEALTVKSPAKFYDQDFVFYLMHKYTNYGTDYVNGTASMQVPRNYTLLVDSEPSVLVGAAGSANVVVANCPQGNLQFKSTSYTSSTYTDGGTVSTTLNLTYATQDVLLKLVSPDGVEGKALLVKGMKPGGTYTLDYNTFERNMVEVAVALPENSARDYMTYLQTSETEEELLRGMTLSHVSGNTYAYPAISNAYKHFLYAFTENISTPSTDYQKITTIQEMTSGFVFDPLVATVTTQIDAAKKLAYTISTTHTYDVATFFYASEGTYDFELVVNTGKTSGEFTLIDMKQVFPQLSDTDQPIYTAYRLFDMKLGGYQKFVASPSVTMFDNEPDGPFRVLVGWNESDRFNGRVGAKSRGKALMPF